MSLAFDQTSEQYRQHLSWKERRARLERGQPVVAKPVAVVPPEPKPVATVPVAPVENYCFDAAGRDWLDVTERFRVRDIMRAACKEFGISKFELVSARRSADIIFPRHMIFALSKRLTRKSLPEIGRIMGSRDHTTVLHACRKLAPVIAYLDQHMTDQSTLEEWITEFREAAKIIPWAVRKKREKA